MHIHLSPSNTNDSLNNSHKNMQDILNINDEIIDKTNWSPLNGGGQSSKSHKLIQINEDRVQFKISLKSAIFYIYSIAVGLFVMFIALFGNLFGFTGSGNPILIFLVGVLFFSVGIFLLLRASKKITIDKSILAIWKGKEDATKTINPSTIEGFTSLKTLHAIQVIKEYIRVDNHDNDEDGFSFNPNKNSYYSYEVNLVFNNGKRLNVLDHGDKKTIYKHANHLSSFLSVPLWDGAQSEDNDGSFLNPTS